MQESNDANEDQRVKNPFQTIFMEEELFEEEEEVHGLEDKGSAPFLTRAAYKKSLFEGTACEFVVAAKRQAYQREEPVAVPTILKESEPEASPDSNDYADLQITQPTFVPNLVTKKGEESSPSSFASLFVQETIPQSFPLNTEAGKNSMLKADMGNIYLDILKPT